MINKEESCRMKPMEVYHLNFYRNKVYTTNGLYISDYGYVNIL